MSFTESIEFQAWFNNIRVDHEMLGLDYWHQQSSRLQSALAGQTAQFISSASLDEVASVAGDWFAALSENTKTAIVAAMRK